MKEASNKKTQRAKVTQYDQVDSKRENMFKEKRNVLRVFVIVSGPVGNPESSSVYRRSPLTRVQIPGFVPVDSSLVNV